MSNTKAVTKHFDSEDILDHMVYLSRTIGKVLVSAKISAQLLRAKQGPMTLTFEVRLIEPTRENLNLVKNSGPLLGQHTGVGPVRVIEGVGSIFFEFPSPLPLTPSAAKLAVYAQGRVIAVGMDHWADPVYLNLSRYPNLLIVGPPRSGKTSAMRSILYQAIQDSKGTVEYIILAERLETWGVFRGIAGCVALYLEPKEGQRALELLVTQMKEKANRAETFKPPVFVLIDDLVSILKAVPDISGAIKTLATAGGAVGVFLMMGTQTAGSREGTGGNTVEDSFVARLVYKTLGAQASYRATGNADQGVEDLTDIPGDGLLLTGHTRTRIATGYVEDENILENLPPYVGVNLKLNTLPIHTGGSGNNTTPVTGLTVETKSLTLPKIKPARIPNEAEVAQIKAYLENNRVSGNFLMQSIFDGKSGDLRSKLIAGLGEEYWNAYFPSRTNILNS